MRWWVNNWNEKDVRSFDVAVEDWMLAGVQMLEGEGELTPTWRSKSQYVGVFKSSANRSSKTPCTRLRIQHPLSHYYYYE